MKYLSILLLSVFLFLLPLKFASAEKVHGIAMHGTPKYSNNFTHLDYVNPNAPKGGTVKFGSYGSFDNLNRVLPRGEFLPVPLLSCISFGPPLWLERDEAKLDFLARARRAVLSLKE